MSARKSGALKGKDVIHSLESYNRQKLEAVIAWEYFVDTTTKAIQEIFDVFIIFWKWLYSWSTVLFDSNEKELITNWLQSRMPEVPPDFSESWKDGVLLCVLLESLNPGSCPRPDLLDRNQGIRNISKALEIIEHFDISPGVTAEEIAACSPYTSKKLISLLLKLKRKSELYSSKETDGKEHLPFRRPPEVQACFAKGTGLVVGCLNRPARFTIFLDSMHDLDIVIEIKGPGNIICCERITTRSPKRKKSFSKTTHKLKLPKIRRSTSFNEEQLEDNRYKAGNNDSIQLEYELKYDRISVEYTPIRIGEHKITILWHGQYVPGSPYHVSVKDTFEKLNANNITSLRPSLKHNENLNITDSQKRAPKIRKQSVRFKNNELGDKEWGKVIKRKILRYVLKLNGKEVGVEVDRSDLLAPALLKLDCELENDMPCHRRNSWGFVGDVERKKSFVRQFCVDLEDSGIYGTQRRSSSFHLTDNSDTRQFSSTVDDNSVYGKSLPLKTVTEGTDIGFRREGKVNELHESNRKNGISSFDDNITFERADTEQQEMKKNNKDLFSQISLSSQEKSKDDDFQKSDIKSNTLSKQIQNDETFSSYIEQSAGSKSNFTPMVNMDQHIMIKQYQAFDTSSERNFCNEIRTAFFDVDQREMHSHRKSHVKQNNHYRISPKNNIENATTEKYEHISMKNQNPFKSPRSPCTRRKLKLKIKPNKRLISNKKKNLNIPKIHSRHDKLRKYITSKKVKMATQYETKFLKKSFSPFKVKKPLGNKRKPTTSQKSVHMFQFGKMKKRTNVSTLLKFRSFEKDIDLKSPYILQNIVKSINYVGNTSDQYENLANASTEVCPLDLEKAVKENEIYSTIDGSDSKIMPPLQTFVITPKYSLVSVETSSTRPSNNKSLPDNLKLNYHSSEKSSTHTHEPFKTKEEFSSIREITKGHDGKFNHFTSPVFILQNFKDRGKSFSHLSLKQSVKNIVKDIERNTFYFSDDLIAKDKNFYSQSLTFPPLAVNEDRVRVKNRIMQWETTSSLPSSLSKSKDSYKIVQEKEKLAILSDVQAKTAFWETAYSNNSLGCSAVQKQLKTTENKKSDISVSDSKIFHYLAHRNEESKENRSSADSPLRQNSNSELHDNMHTSQTLKLNSIYMHHLKHQIQKRTNSRQLVERRASDPGSLAKIKNVNSELMSKLALSCDEMKEMDLLSSVGAMTSSVEFSHVEDKEDLGDEYIDDDIPDYAAMFWDDYAPNVGLLFDSRRNGLTPNADEVKVFGGGVYYGHVSVKNHFQVLTKGAGKGHLAVSVQGSSLHDVINVSVVYARKDIYNVFYQVIEPGYYIISIRWSGTLVPGSPFVCKVTY